MDNDMWKELGYQALVGFIYGMAAAVLTVDGFSKMALIAVAIGAIKGCAHAVVKMMAPKEVNAGQKFRIMHWTEKIDRIL